MMRALFIALLALHLSACGHKGSLKTPAQIEAEEAKKAKQAQQEGK